MPVPLAEVRSLFVAVELNVMLASKELSRDKHPLPSVTNESYSIDSRGQCYKNAAIYQGNLPQKF